MMNSSPVRVKICCIASEAEAQLAVDCGASAVGLVSAMPSGPGPIPEALIQRISASTPKGISTFLLTCLKDAEAIIDQQRRTGVNTIQLVDSVPVEAYSKIRNAIPDIRLVQVIHVTGEESVCDAAGIAPHVDAVLLDSGNPAAPTKELGGTGRTHDWKISRRIRDVVAVPLYLAGGLNSDNVGNAIAQVEPFGVDVCSGVRTSGRLDERKLRAFVEALHGGNGGGPR